MVCTLKTHLYRGGYNALLYETREQFQERFWSCVDRNVGYDIPDHWYWLGSRDSMGRPLFIFNGIDMYADVLAKIWNKGPERFECKKYYDCSPKDCVNPYHLLSYNEITTFYHPPKLTLDSIDTAQVIALFRPTGISNRHFG